MLAKEFPGGILVMTGANSAVGLRSLPARYLFLDEVDAYPPSADEEGDPVALAEARTLTFAHRRKIFLVSTPTIQGVSRIEREYLASDQRRFFVPCPHCGAMQWLRFERLRWDKGQPETAPTAARPASIRSPSGTRRRCCPPAVAADRDRQRPADRRLPPLRPLRAPGLAELGADRRPARAGARGGRDPPCLRQRRPGRDLGRDRRQPGLAAAVRAARGLAAWARCPREGCC